MKIPKLSRQLKQRIRSALDQVEPVVRVVDKVAGIAVQMHKPTVIGVAGAVAAGMSAVRESLSLSPPCGPSVYAPVSRGTLIDALLEHGATCSDPSSEGMTTVLLEGRRVYVHHDGSVSSEFPRPELVQVLRTVLDKMVAQSVLIEFLSGDDGSTFSERPVELTRYRSAQAAGILRATKSMVGTGGRCLLLEGRPGVGKSTIAQIIARDIGLGRTVFLPASFLLGTHLSQGTVRDVFSTLPVGVVIVDDVDKKEIDLALVEILRGKVGLLILTANNGDSDEVLDGALMRPGRVDEVFRVEPEPLAGRPKEFGALSDEEWAEVCGWPVAFQVELAARLRSRPDDPRIDDLRARVAYRVASKGVLR